MELARPNPTRTLPQVPSWIWRGLESLWRSRRPRESLFVRETASLGERRFVVVVQFEHQRFLIGAGPNSITLLAQLGDQSDPPSDSKSGETHAGGEP